jgi:hypothetical protein
MFRISAYSRFLIAITMLVAGLTAAQALPIAGAPQALPVAGAHAPTGVPAGFVITPFGYFHPSCVNQLAKGDVLHSDSKTIEHANGNSDKIPQCAYPHYRADGVAVTDERAGGDPPYFYHSWVEWSTVTTTSAYWANDATWNVPFNPTDNDGQTLFFFDGMQDTHDVVTIIQPVLGWNSDYAGAWGIASWNCCVNGAANEASPAPVNVGDTILGETWNNCSAGTKTCDSWNILTYDVSTGAYSEFLGVTNYGQTFNWAFGGVMEVYNIYQCGDYPSGPFTFYGGSTGSIDFYEQALFTDKQVRITNPKYTIGTTSGLSPTCNEGGLLPGETILTY